LLNNWIKVSLQLILISLWFYLYDSLSHDSSRTRFATSPSIPPFPLFCHSICHSVYHSVCHSAIPAVLPFCHSTIPTTIPAIPYAIPYAIPPFRHSCHSAIQPFQYKSSRRWHEFTHASSNIWIRIYDLVLLLFITSAEVPTVLTQPLCGYLVLPKHLSIVGLLGRILFCPTTVQRSGRATYNDACTGDRYAATTTMKNALTKSTTMTTMVWW
jgi:hypothetical protein